MDFLKVKILGQYKQLIQFNKSFLQFLKKKLKKKFKQGVNTRIQELE